jgi:hypothetical protein
MIFKPKNFVQPWIGIEFSTGRQMVKLDFYSCMQYLKPVFLFLIDNKL